MELPRYVLFIRVEIFYTDFSVISKRVNFNQKFMKKNVLFLKNGFLKKTVNTIMYSKHFKGLVNEIQNLLTVFQLRHLHRIL